jgi:hypothetical protein
MFQYKQSLLLPHVPIRMFLLEHVVAIKTVSIGTCGNYKDCLYWNMWQLWGFFPLQHVVTIKTASIGTCCNYKDCCHVFAYYGSSERSCICILRFKWSVMYLYTTVQVSGHVFVYNGSSERSCICILWMTTFRFVCVLLLKYRWNFPSEPSKKSSQNPLNICLFDTDMRKIYPIIVHIN